MNLTSIPNHPGGQAEGLLPFGEGWFPRGLLSTKLMSIVYVFFFLEEPSKGVLLSFLAMNLHPGLEINGSKQVLRSALKHHSALDGFG